MIELSQCFRHSRFLIFGIVGMRRLKFDVRAAQMKSYVVTLCRCYCFVLYL